MSALSKLVQTEYAVMSFAEKKMVRKLGGYSFDFEKSFWACARALPTLEEQAKSVLPRIRIAIKHRSQMIVGNK